MPKIYRKVNSQMNRPKYGTKAKPVRQSKARLVLIKPKVLELKKVYSTLSKAATWQRLDIYSRAIQWYRSALLYIEQTGATYSAPTAKHLSTWHNRLGAITGKGFVQPPLLDSKYLEALHAACSICNAHGIKAPAIKDYLKRGVVAAKKLDAKEKTLTTKYDKILTLFTQAYGASLTLKVSPTLSTTHKFDHAVKTLYYSTAQIQAMTKQLRAEGLLPLVIDEAWYVARALCFEGLQQGLFLSGVTVAIVKKYQGILHDFAQWSARSSYAPKTLVKRVSRKKKSVTQESADEVSE